MSRTQSAPGLIDTGSLAGKVSFRPLSSCSSTWGSASSWILSDGSTGFSAGFSAGLSFGSRVRCSDMAILRTTGGIAASVPESTRASGLGSCFGPFGEGPSHGFHGRLPLPQGGRQEDPRLRIPGVASGAEHRPGAWRGQQPERRAGGAGQAAGGVGRPNHQVQGATEGGHLVQILFQVDAGRLPDLHAELAAGGEQLGGAVAVLQGYEGQAP